jgi:N-acetylglucosaminyldiphosphoundecaprenol N-acetyl-beta-D-mannosaminyltransferase
VAPEEAGYVCPRRIVGALAFSVIPLDQAIDLVMGLGTSRQQSGTAIHFANAYNIALADTDPHYAEVMMAGDYVFTDGMPVAWAGRRLHSDIASSWERVYGPDIMTAVLSKSTSAGPHHYLLGSTPETLGLLTDRINRNWPEAQIVGAESPPFRELSVTELKEQDERIRSSGATCVWVGLGTPKQDYEVGRLAAALPVTALAVGAAFDFLSGSVPQAPRWMQRSGLEWCYRLAREPKRLAKRYLWGNPKFVVSVARQWRSGGRPV